MTYQPDPALTAKIDYIARLVRRLSEADRASAMKELHKTWRVSHINGLTNEQANWFNAYLKRCYFSTAKPKEGAAA